MRENERGTREEAEGRGCGRQGTGQLVWGVEAVRAAPSWRKNARAARAGFYLLQEELAEPICRLRPGIRMPGRKRWEISHGQWTGGAAGPLRAAFARGSRDRAAVRRATAD